MWNTRRGGQIREFPMGRQLPLRYCHNYRTWLRLSWPHQPAQKTGSESQFSLMLETIAFYTGFYANAV